MPGSRHKILSHVFSSFSEKMGRTKVLDIGTQATETPLKRCLTTFDITLLGIPKCFHILIITKPLSLYYICNLVRCIQYSIQVIFMNYLDRLALLLRYLKLGTKFIARFEKIKSRYHKILSIY